MKPKLKPIDRQTILITGATSGIGLTTARMAAARGANVVLVARNEGALRRLTDEINVNGGRAIYAVADVADEGALRRAARAAQDRFGGVDTWVNNAGGAVYGRIMDVPMEDFRRMFETNLWGVVNGSRIAVEHLRERGGALINVGSEASDAPVPLLGMYAASKHAVKGFTDALRMELEADGLPISVTLVKPTAIHTPFSENARNHLPYEPRLPPPVYAPELAAEAILECARRPRRDIFVGGAAKAHSVVGMGLPRLFAWVNERVIDRAQNAGRPAEAHRPDGLYRSNSDLRQRGAADRHVISRSAYQQAEMHPVLAAAVAVGIVLGVAGMLRQAGRTGAPRR